MPPKETLQTYVAFIVPHSSEPQKGIAVPFAVESRDLADLDIPREACAFYFYDAPAKLTPQESLAHKKNTSKEYLLAHETLTRHEVKVMLAGADYKSLEGRMQWDSRVEAHDIFIVTRNHSIQPVTENHVVINANLQQVHPKTPQHGRTIAPEKLAGLYNPVLQKDVLIPSMPNPRRRRPPQGDAPPPR
ncbi:MAG: hypothetical protein H3C49_09585 [Alphaproteobacteria bacterium]|nr:hypothetical protein [Alphaproteobacteria bacterium]